LVSNEPAIALYEKLGFKTIDKTQVSLSMEFVLPTKHTGKNVKVIACYGGDRRSSLPSTAKDGIKLLKFIWQKEQELDQGVYMDTVFVHNKPCDGPEIFDEVSSVEDLKEYQNILMSFHGQRTKNGIAIVLERANIGISFGAFDLAYRSFREHYDFWMFVEDDVVPTKQFTMLNGMKQLLEPRTPQLGFIALVGISAHNAGKYIVGGCGISRREILGINCGNYNKSLLCHTLPFSFSKERTAPAHIGPSEIPFTNGLSEQGYAFDDICDWPNVVGWRLGNRRSFLYNIFTDDMIPNGVEVTT